jgi:putative phosphoribosyl transferase
MLPGSVPLQVPLFRDRVEAGHALAAALAAHAHVNPLVLGVPRGGVPVAAEVAKALRAPLDVLVACKVGAPGHPEFAIGAVAEGDLVVRDEPALEYLGVSDGEFAVRAARAQAEVSRRVLRYRGNRPPLSLKGRDVVLVDDGIATGATAKAACRAARAMGARRVVFASPVAAADSVKALEREADEVVVLAVPHPFDAVGKWYRAFPSTSDDEVMEILRLSPPPTPARGAGRVLVRALSIPIEDVHLRCELAVPEGAHGLVVFAHGSGSGRLSPRNQKVAAAFNARGLATLLVDLLTAREEADQSMTGELRFDVPFLAARLRAAAEWAAGLPALRDLPLGYFGASTGAAAALTAAAVGAPPVAAVVSRGGRPDLSAIALEAVTVPTLLIVGGDDREVLALNRKALEHLSGPRRLTVVPGASHLFEEPGALEEVARAAADWFDDHLAAPEGARRTFPERPWGSIAS